MKSPQSFALIFLLAVSHCAAEDREWQRINDGKRVEAAYVRFQDGKVVLRRHSDKELFAVSVAALTFQDREHLAKLAPEQMAGVELRRYPSAISRYELATADDLYYSRLLDRAHAAADKSVEKWPLWKQLKSETSSVVAQLLDAKQVTVHIATTCDAGGTDSPLAPLQTMVDDCAKILGVPSPHVRVRNERTPAAYVFGHDEPFLVINSGLTELFEDSPEELRFMIGRELGHLKCHHLEMNAIGYATVEILSKVGPAIIAQLASKFGADPKTTAEGVRKIITPILLGQLLSWRRESEFTADRAGLLCCQDTGVALEALWRLKHGIRKGSRYYDATKKVNVDAVLADLEYWENKPFIDLIRQMNTSTHPFIEQRMAMVTKWHEKGAMDEILSRKSSGNSELFITVDRVGIDKFTSGDNLRDVYLKGYVEDTLWFTTPTQNDRFSAIWEKQPTSMRIQSGQPVFFELWEDGTVYDAIIGVFVVYPRAEITQYQRPFREDVETRPEKVMSPKALLKLSTYPVRK